MKPSLRSFIRKPASRRTRSASGSGRCLCARPELGSPFRLIPSYGAWETPLPDGSLRAAACHISKTSFVWRSSMSSWASETTNGTTEMVMPNGRDVPVRQQRLFCTKTRFWLRANPTTSKKLAHTSREATVDGLHQTSRHSTGSAITPEFIASAFAKIPDEFRRAHDRSLDARPYVAAPLLQKQEWIKANIGVFRRWASAATV